MKEPDNISTIPWQLFYPKQWLSWLLIALVWLLSKLPVQLLLPIGKQFGKLLYYLEPKMRRVAHINLGLCFPAMLPKQRTALLKQSYQSLGMGLMETALGWWGSSQKLQHLLTIDGLEYLQQAKQAGTGVLLVTAHFSSLELLGRLFSLTQPLVATYRPQRSLVLDYVTARARQPHYHALFAKHQTRQIIKALRQGETVFFAADTDAGHHGKFIPLLGVNAATVTATTRYAALGKANVIFAKFHRLPNCRYQLTLSKPLSQFPSNDITMDCLRINNLISDAIIEHPEQYLWQYRRFKTRPNGEHDYYWRRQ